VGVAKPAEHQTAQIAERDNGFLLPYQRIFMTDAQPEREIIFKN